MNLFEFVYWIPFIPQKVFFDLQKKHKKLLDFTLKGIGFNKILKRKNRGRKDAFY
jgi:hypothetical protein